MSYRPALAAQLDKMRIPTSTLDTTVRIENPSIPIKPIVALGAGMFITTQLVLRYRFGNI